MPCTRSPGGWYPSMPCRFPGPHPRGSLGPSSWGGGCGESPGPQPRGKLRGIWSKPTPKGEVEGDLARGDACSGGACSGGVCSRGVWRPPPVTATAVGGTHPTGMHSC